MKKVVVVIILALTLLFQSLPVRSGFYPIRYNLIVETTVAAQVPQTGLTFGVVAITFGATALTFGG